MIVGSCLIRSCEIGFNKMILILQHTPVDCSVAIDSMSHDLFLKSLELLALFGLGPVVSDQFVRGTMFHSCVSLLNLVGDKKEQRMSNARVRLLELRSPFFSKRIVLLLS